MKYECPKVRELEQAEEKNKRLEARLEECNESRTYWLQRIIKAGQKFGYDGDQCASTAMEFIEEHTPKPVVWVRRVYLKHDKSRFSHYELCSPSGAVVSVPNYITSIESIKDVLDAIELKADIRIWPDDCEEPETEWAYGVWEMENTCDGKAMYMNGKCYGHACGSSIEDYIRGLLELPKESSFNWDILKISDTPIFGVRSLNSKAWYVAFYNGKQLKGSGCGNPKKCIEWVLSRLTPATPAVTLDDLEVA